MRIKKGDTVKVISGKDKGKTGNVLRVLRNDNKVVVEGCNIVSRHTRPSQQNQDGGIIKKEAPIDASNVQILDPTTKEVTRIGYKEVDGKKVRYAKKSNTVLDK